MPTDLLPALTTAYPVSNDDVASYRTNGHVRLTLRYGSTGRPEHCFEWLGRRD